MVRRFILTMLGLWFAALGSSVLAQDPVRLVRGEIIPKIATAQGGVHYALYLPTTYNPARPGPILFVLDPRGNAVPAAEVFKAGAERHGYILVSAYESRSDSGTEANFPSLKAMLKDVGERLSFDVKRTYVAGFSGTARFAIELSRKSNPGPFAGIVAAGAGYPFGMKPRQGDDFAIYATVGEEDFNWPEMHHFEEQSASAGTLSFLDTHAGPHNWPPPEIASDALGWFAVQAMRSGRAAADPATVDAMWSRFSARAQAAERAGDIIAAQRLWAMLAAQFAGLRDTRLAAARASALAADPRLAQAKRERDRLIAHDDAVQAQAWAAFDLPNVDAAALELDLDRLNRQAKTDPDARRRASAKRSLAYIAGQANSYRAAKPIQNKDWKRVLFLFSIGIRARPEDAWRYVARAQVEMKIGNRRRALADLEKAVALGYANAAAIETDNDFDPLRATTEFAAILARMQANSPG